MGKLDSTIHEFRANISDSLPVDGEIHSRHLHKSV